MDPSRTVSLEKKSLAYALHERGWSLRLLAKYFRRSRQAIFNWVQEIEKYI